MALNTYTDRRTSVQIKDIYIESEQWDLKNFFVRCLIFEDMYTHFMTGQVLILDAISMTEKIPLTGWQKLVITFQSNADGPFVTWSKTFRIYKIGNASPDSNSGTRSRSYMLYFISDEANKEMSNRISRSYVNMTEDQIVNDVGTNVLGCSNLECEPAKYPKSLIVPNWKPVQLIDYCCKTAIRASGYEAANFMFYETIDGYKFKSLDSIVESGADSVHVTSGAVAQLFGQDDSMTSTTRQAKSFNSKNNFDFIASSRRGAFGTRFSGLDTISKKWKNFDYVYSSDFGAMPKIDGGNQILTDNTIDVPDQFQKFGPWQSEPRGYNSDYNHKHVHKRKGHMGLWENIVYHADIDGDTRVKLGSKVAFDLPSYDGTNPESQNLDSQHSGNYIVTQIAHSFNSMQHRQTLGLRKHMLKGG
jgi:hypothetical protein